MLMVNCGYTWEYIDNFMTLPKLAALTKYWSHWPPIGHLIAGIAIRVGYDWQSSSPAGGDAEAAKLRELESVAAQLNNGAR